MDSTLQPTRARSPERVTGASRVSLLRIAFAGLMGLALALAAGQHAGKHLGPPAIRGAR